jgi:hypothetical protein
MSTYTNRLAILLPLLAAMATGCVPRTATPGAPAVPPEYAALADTLVCVVDRIAPDGLREVPAKIRGGGVVLLVDGEVRSLESVHPTNLIAGYAGQETWVRQGEPVSLGGQRFSRTGGERRIEFDLLRRAGEFRGILLFSGREDASDPSALYVPTAPGCIFQAYVREDLIRR